MPGISKVKRDHGVVRQGLVKWMAHRFPDREGIDIRLLGENQTNGFSSETLMVSATWTEHGRGRTSSFVVRLPPAGGGLFKEYDLRKQSYVQAFLHGKGLPTPDQLAYEADASWTGSDFILMQKVEGRVPEDIPPYFFGGWLLDSSAQDQRTFYNSYVEILARIATVDISSLDRTTLDRPQGPGLGGEIAWWEDYYLWATEDAPRVRMQRVLEWCKANRPAIEPPPSLVWGDARFGNTIVGADYRVAGVLDWEMTTVGPAELDFGWWLGQRKYIRVQEGLDPDGKELEGFSPRRETIEKYSLLLGRPLLDLEWYEIFGVLRFAITVQGCCRAVRSMGVTEHFIFQMEPIHDWVMEMLG